MGSGASVAAYIQRPMPMAVDDPVQFLFDAYDAPDTWQVPWPTKIARIPWLDPNFKSGINYLNLEPSKAGLMARGLNP